MARIVFDLDGTLIDSVPDLHVAANRLLAEVGLPPLSIAEVRSFVGRGAAVFVQKLRAARGIGDDQQDVLLARYVDLLEQETGLTTIYPNVVEALTALSGVGHALGLCTNKPGAPTRAVLQSSGLASHFGTVIAGDSLPRRKPDPAPLMAAFGALGEGPMIYVGDSEVDAETAERAGVPFLLFTEGYRVASAHDLTHSAYFDDFEELPKLVADLLI